MLAVELAEVAQELVDVLAQLLGVEITVVDHNLVRLAGTGYYRDYVGKTVRKAHVFTQVMRSGQRLVVANPGRHEACVRCCNKEACPDRAAVYAPVRIGAKVIGAIGVVALNEPDREKLLSREREFLWMAEAVAQLVSERLVCARAVQELQLMINERSVILDSVRDGVVGVGEDGKLMYANHSAMGALGLTPQTVAEVDAGTVFPPSILQDVLVHGRAVVDQKVALSTGGMRRTVVVTGKPIFSGSGVAGGVFCLRDYHEAGKPAWKISYSHCLRAVSFEEILGTSPALSEAKRVALKAARGHSTVLILGESGTGKELFARAIHTSSPRAAGPFVPINCAAVPETLLESELFGYEEGAFTGARKGGKPGKCELADGGTLFLDEVGDLPFSLQGKLLRMLQERYVERVGGVRQIPIDVRVVAATGRDLERMVAQREFRDDLYYRLNVIPIRLPPLRERREDIKLLAEHFAKRYAEVMKKSIKGLTEEVLLLFLEYDWPGNVRELENALEYAVTMESSSVITLASVPPWLQSRNRSTVVADGLCSRGFEHREARVTWRTLPASRRMQAIRAALERYGHSTEGKRLAAESLGMSLATLYRWLKKENGEVGTSDPDPLGGRTGRIG